MIAFHGKQEIKDKYLARVRAHRMADEIVKGLYWQDGKGCAVGCTVHSGNHLAYESEMGIPALIARLEDALFERLPNEKAMEWPERFLSSIQVGADLRAVGPKFMIWLLVDPDDGIIRYVTDEKVKTALQSAGALYRRMVNGEIITADDWLTARDAIAAIAAIDDIADIDARAAIDAITARAAIAAIADIADIDARAAIDAITARAAIAAITARAAIAAIADIDAKNYIRMSDKLIELLENATVPLEELRRIARDHEKMFVAAEKEAYNEGKLIL